VKSVNIDQTFAELRQEFVAPFNSNFHNKTLCESGVMWITRFVTYLSIAFQIYLLIIIHFWLIIIKNVSIHDSGMTFCTFIRYAQSQIIKKKEFDGKKTN
jgi:hypothetical protein